METITLNDGTILAGRCHERSDKLFVYLYEMTLANAYTYLSVPQNTVHIISNQFDTVTEFSGYNHLYCISEESGNEVSAILKKA